MKTTLRLGYIALFAATIGATSASDVAVNSTVTRACQINTAGTSSAIDLTGLGVNVRKQGDFEYQCNFVGGGTTVTIASANGALKNGIHTANYGVFLNTNSPEFYGAPLPSQWHPSNALGSGFPFFNIVIPAAANTPQHPYFYVGLTQPANVAGTYQDTLTFTISP